MKKLVTLACNITLAIALCGCSGGSDTGTPPNIGLDPVPTAAPIVPLISLQYDEPSGNLVAINSAGGQDFTITNTFDFAERAPGVLNKALRTDGYSTWAQGTLLLNNIQELTIQTWVALENYPADAEVTYEQLTPSSLLHQSSGSNGFNFAINTFGQWSFSVSISGTNYQLDAPDNFPLYEWTHIAAVIDGFHGNITLYLNGDPIATTDSNPIGGTIDAANVDLIVGKGPIAKSSGIFTLLNGINGLFDETHISSGSINAENIKNQYQIQSTAIPQSAELSLAVPDSRFIDDLQRPVYHAMPPSAWTNEPHGLVKFNGSYHMFYQRTANGPFKTQTMWGHMQSDDFVHWHNKRNALIPSLESSQTFGYDMKGIWAGDVVVEDDTAYAFYTNVNHAGPFNPGIAVATSTDENLVDWQKLGPIIGAENVEDFRDPYLFKDGNTWHMIIGAKINGVGGLDHYSTTNISDSQSWQRSAFSTVPYADMDVGSTIWELPVFENIGNGKYVLVVNPIGGSLGRFAPNPVRAVYWIGTWQNGQFTPDSNQPKNLDLIHGHLSPAVTRNANDELVAIGIVDERRNSESQLAAGWTHTFSVPRVWGLASDDSTLTQKPAEQLQSLRITDSLINLTNQTVNGSMTLPIRGRSLEIIAQIDSGDTASNYGLTFAGNKQKTEYTQLYYDIANQQIVLDRTNSSLSDTTQEDVLHRADYDEAVFGKPEKFHVFIDHSVVDVFINDMAAFSVRIYPTLADSDKVELFSQNADTLFTDVKAWNLENIGTTRSYIVLSDDGEIIEGSENNEAIQVKLVNNQFVSTLSPENWQLTSLPVGVTMGSIVRISDNQARITLSGNSTVDFDADLHDISLVIPASEVVDVQQPNPILGYGVSIISIVETVTTGTINSTSEIYEGGEDGKQITISLANNTFNIPFDESLLTANNLPQGINYSVALSDAQTLLITLMGNPQSYNNSDALVTFSIAASALTNEDPELNGEGIITNPIIFKARIVHGVSVASDAYDQLVTSFDNAVDVIAQGWTATGTFAELATPDAWEGTAQADEAAKIGLRAVSTCEINFNSAGCDAPTGSLSSPVLKVTENFLYMLLAGGNGSAPVGIRVTDPIGNILHTFNPNSCSPAFIDGDNDWTSIDVSSLLNASVRVHLFDEEVSACGFVSIDHIYQSTRDPASADGELPSPIIDGGTVVLDSTQLAALSFNIDLPYADSDEMVLGNFDDAIAMLDNGWVATGIFASPENGSAWQGTARNSNLAAARVGTGAVSTCEINTNEQGCNAPIGSLTSPAFMVTTDKPVLSFLMAGGNGVAPLGLRVLNAIDDTIILTHTANSCESSHIDGNEDWVSLDLTANVGQSIKIQVFDEDAGDCGFVSFDHLHMSSGQAIDPSKVDFNLNLTDFSETVTNKTLTNATVNNDGFDQVIGSFDNALNMLALGWQATGAFANPANAEAWSGTARPANASAARIGGLAVSTCEINANSLGCDSPTGTLLSPTFKVHASRPYLNFMMAGGNGVLDLGLRVIDAETSGNIATFKPNTCSPSHIDGDDDWHSIDLTAQIGKFVQIKLVDNETGSCGFVSFDHVNMSATAR